MNNVTAILTGNEINERVVSNFCTTLYMKNTRYVYYHVYLMYCLNFSVIFLSNMKNCQQSFYYHKRATYYTNRNTQLYGHQSIFLILMKSMYCVFKSIMRVFWLQKWLLNYKVLMLMRADITTRGYNTLGMAFLTALLTFHFADFAKINNKI